MGTLEIELAIGIIGAVVLIIAWLWETWENVERHKITIHMHFAILYILGNAMLAVYSWMISNQIFFALSIIMLVAITAEISYAIRLRR
jgi:hypothetical protein